MLKFLPFLCMLTACTYSINMIHSEGGSDLLDETQEASPVVSPNLNIPLVVGTPRDYPPENPRGMNGPDRQKIISS